MIDANAVFRRFWATFFNAIKTLVLDDAASPKGVIAELDSRAKEQGCEKEWAEFKTIIRRQQP